PPTRRPSDPPASPQHPPAATSRRSLQACIASLPLQSSLMSDTYLKSDHFNGGGSAGWQSESLPAFNFRANPRNGTRNQLVMGPLSLSCFRCRRYCSRPTPLGERKRRYSPFQGCEVYLARSSSGIIHSCRKKSSRF